MSRVFIILALVAASGAASHADLTPPEPASPQEPLAAVSAAPPEPVKPGAAVIVNGGGWSLQVQAPAPPEGLAEFPPQPTPVRARRVEPARPAAPSTVFTPDVYPSEIDAARGLGEAWVSRAAERWRREPESVRIYCRQPGLYAAIADGVRSRLPGARIEKAPGDEWTDGFHGGRPGGDEAWLLVEPSSDAAAGAAGDRKSKVVTGTLSLQSKGASDAAASARFVEKPWLANFAAFSHGQPRRWVVGRSDPLRPAMSEGEAARAAREAAAGELFDLVRPRLARGDDEWLRRRLGAKLAGGRLVVDQFPQKFERRFGATWRGAVLVDASPQNLNDLTSELVREQRAQRKGVFVSAASAGGVLLVTYALYRLANAFTRGYFVWSLRTAAAATASAAVVLVRLIQG